MKIYLGHRLHSIKVLFSKAYFNSRWELSQFKRLGKSLTNNYYVIIKLANFSHLKNFFDLFWTKKNQVKVLKHLNDSVSQRFYPAKFPQRKRKLEEKKRKYEILSSLFLVLE